MNPRDPEQSAPDSEPHLVLRDPHERLVYMEGWVAGATVAAGRREVFEACAEMMRKELVVLRDELGA